MGLYRSFQAPWNKRVGTVSNLRLRAKSSSEEDGNCAAADMRSVVKAASLGLAVGQGARELFAPVAPGQVYNQYPTQYVQYDAAPQYAYEQPVPINVLLIQGGSGVGWLLQLWRARFRLYRSRFLQRNVHLPEIFISVFKLFRRKFNIICLFPPRIVVSSKC